MNSKHYSISKYLLLVFILATSLIATGQNNDKKSIVFIDDFDTYSELEPDYYKYFDEIKAGKLLGDLNYSRLNVNFDLEGNKSIRHLQISEAPDYLVLILGSSNTTINTKTNDVVIASEDYKNEYLAFVKRLKHENSKIIIVSPPPYLTKTKEEDEQIIDNINAVQYVAESHPDVSYIKLYKYILRNYQESTVSPKQLATWITALIQEDVVELKPED
ncbi:MAG: hypothetical protein ABFR62_04955 [Bacteroidota bacterium]